MLIAAMESRHGNTNAPMLDAPYAALNPSTKSSTACAPRGTGAPPAAARQTRHTVYVHPVARGCHSAALQPIQHLRHMRIEQIDATGRLDAHDFVICRRNPVARANVGRCQQRRCVALGRTHVDTKSADIQSSVDATLMSMITTRAATLTATDRRFAGTARARARAHQTRRVSRLGLASSPPRRPPTRTTPSNSSTPTHPREHTPEPAAEPCPHAQQPPPQAPAAVPQPASAPSRMTRGGVAVAQHRQYPFQRRAGPAQHQRTVVVTRVIGCRCGRASR